MLLSKKLLPKLEEILKQYYPLRYERVSPLIMEAHETPERLNSAPEGPWKPIKEGDTWGDDDGTCWFRATLQVPTGLRDQQLALYTEFGCEAGLFLNGVPVGVFTRDDTAKDHQYALLPKSTDFSKTADIAIEAWAGNTFPGTMPFQNYKPVTPGCRVYTGVWFCAEREDVFAFVMDLEVLLRLQESLHENDLRKWEIMKGLQKVWERIPALPAEVDEAEWQAALADARAVMKPLLDCHNGPTTPRVSVIAHSHLDTAWLWPIVEARRKCYRTFGSMVTLMERYPEITFIQSSPIHADMVRQDQPELFARMKALIAEGRWEPNGGAWVEPDCNLTSGESLVRQFLHGIRWTREQFGYSPDMFWQPDVFGYSAALPQILQGFGIKYFCTTKMAWNDTTRFPYDTFRWRGIDGTEVLSHLTWLHFDPDPKQIIHKWDWAQHKDSETHRLAAYGWGDGGGGPTQESVEYTRRLHDLEGCPKVEHTTVSQFMQDLEAERSDWPVYVGELYLELHRGTLTSYAEIKKSNRQMECLLRDAEYVYTSIASSGGSYPTAQLDALWKETLKNQFHDILPGSSIGRVNDEAKADYRRMLTEVRQLIADGMEEIIGRIDTPDAALIQDSTCLPVDGILELGEPFISKGLYPESAPWQKFTNLMGEDKILVLHSAEEIEEDVEEIPSLIPLTTKAIADDESPFVYTDNTLETPCSTIEFDDLGRITSFYLHEEDREVVPAGGTLNTFLIGEDVPEVWDSWDIDSDQERKMSPVTKLVSREIICDGPLQLRIRSEYEIGRASRLWQDMIFSVDTPLIEFDTKVDWQERHQLLKASFDLDILAETVKHECQFGYVERPNHRNTLQDRAKFEVATHRWSFMHDEGFGVAILNDCKYGISSNGKNMQLTLLKSGTHPDPRADPGITTFRYALFPVERELCPFGMVQAVVWEARSFNWKPLLVPATRDTIPPTVPFQVASDGSVMVDTVKWAEDGSDAFIIRLYESCRRREKIKLEFDETVATVEETNLLEERKHAIPMKNGTVKLSLNPFEIKTLRCTLKR